MCDHTSQVDSTISGERQRVRNVIFADEITIMSMEGDKEP